MKQTISFGVLVLGCLSAAAAADWRQFRGPHGSGVADAELPTAWSETENVAWKAPLPGRGLSGPIVVGDRVFVTCSSGYRQDRLHVICLDEATGDRLWERQFWATGRTMTHNKTCTAASTPVSDGQRIFAYFSSNDLVCLDLEGNLLWLRGLTRHYPNASNSLGLASSPIVVDDVLVVQVETDSESVALGITAATGETRWEIDRPKLANWTSPIVLSGATGKDRVVALQSGRGMTAYDPQDGQQRWHYDRGCATIPSSAADMNTAYVPSNGLVALRYEPGNASPEVLWQESRLRPSTATPVIYGGRVYVIDRSILKCGDAETGELLWQLRLKGNFTSSPVAAGGHIYVFNEEGLGQAIADEGRRGREVGGGDLGEVILCSPAVARGALFVRSDEHLWKIADTGS